MVPCPQTMQDPCTACSRQMPLVSKMCKKGGEGECSRNPCVKGWTSDEQDGRCMHLCRREFCAPKPQIKFSEIYIPYTVKNCSNPFHSKFEVIQKFIFHLKASQVHKGRSELVILLYVRHLKIEDFWYNMMAELYSNCEALIWPPCSAAILPSQRTSFSHFFSGFIPFHSNCTDRGTAAHYFATPGSEIMFRYFS